VSTTGLEVGLVSVGRMGEPHSTMARSAKKGGWLKIPAAASTGARR